MLLPKQRINQKGFTLIELLVVIGILAVLLAITLIAINPARQFQQANNTKRRSDVNAILNAVDQYGADHHGQLPSLSGCTQAAPCVIAKTGTGTVDICSALVTQYLAALPTDPTTGTNGTAAGAPATDCTAAYNTNYTIYQSSSDNRVTVTAPGAELNETISVTR